MTFTLQIKNEYVIRNFHINCKKIIKEIPSLKCKQGKFRLSLCKIPQHYFKIFYGEENIKKLPTKHQINNFMFSFTSRKEIVDKEIKFKDMDHKQCTKQCAIEFSVRVPKTLLARNSALFHTAIVLGSSLQKRYSALFRTLIIRK